MTEIKWKALFCPLAQELALTTTIYRDLEKAISFIKIIRENYPAEEDDKKPLFETLGVLLEAIRHISLQLTPYIPKTAEKISEQIG